MIGKIRKLICDLYLNQKALVRLGEERTEKYVIGGGLCQGYLFSILLLSIYAVIDSLLERQDGWEESKRRENILLK